MKRRKSPCTAILPGLLIAACLAFGASTGNAVTLQSMYSQAGPGDGYDKLVILERGGFYVGPLTIPSGVSCGIRGNDAVCSVGNSDICVQAGATLDVFDTVICNAHYALNYLNGSNGEVSGNTIYGNYNGVTAVLANVTIENNIIAGNSHFGVAVDETMLPTINYNDVWNNSGGNYMSYCSG
jgi:hypothetical protein